MPNVTTPAEAHDATTVTMVRIPERFPDSPTASSGASAATNLLSAQLGDISENGTYKNIVGHKLHFYTPFSSAVTIELTPSNFNSVSGLCLLKLSVSSQVDSAATLTIKISGFFPNAISLVDLADSSANISLVYNTDSNHGFEIIGIHKK